MAAEIKPPRTTKRQEQTIQREFSLDHHIPDALIDEIGKLKNVLHKDLLQEFHESYKDRPFTYIEEEYRFINQVIGRLLDISFTQPLKNVVERNMRFSLAAPYFESIREQFIHPFQVFLLGTVIMDKFFEDFQCWYSKELCSSPETCLESAWLLATIFHDYAKSINALRKTLEIEIGSYANILPKEPFYISKISSVFTHISSKKPLEQWSNDAINNSFATILEDYSSRWNHGVKGSIMMLKHIGEKLGTISHRDIAAALAIAVHDKELHDSLLEHNFFPLDIQCFPLACLLMYCDTVEEWGRTESEATRLVTLRIDNHNVCCEVCFDSSREALIKLAEIEKIQRCIVAKPLILDFGARVHVAR